MEKPNYFAIMPASVRYDKNLKPMEKIIYSEITALVNPKGYCYATNSYFANLYEVHKKTVAHWISNLTNLGYLKVEMILKKGGKEVEERRIYILERRDKVEGVDDKNIDRDLVEREEKKREEKEFFEVENGKEKNKEKVEIIEEEIVEKKTEEEILEGGNKNIPRYEIVPKGMKKWGGWEQNDNHPHHEKVTGNNTSRIIKENNYYIYTYRGEENLPVIREILKKYSELGLPSYEYPPEKNLVMKAYGELGAKGVFKALEIMSKSNFVMEKMCVDTILKVENLKKALNGNFKADVEEKSVELVGKKRESIKKSGDEKKFEESEEGKQWKEEQKRKISELLEKDVEEEDTPELFSVEELFGKR